MKVVITGGCKGLGLSFTKKFLSLGYDVIALYNTSVMEANKLHEEYSSLEVIKCDITSEEEVKKTFDKISNIDILINNAAISKDNDYLSKDKEEFMKVLETNVVGTFLVTKYASLKMNNGLIINISSNNAIDSYDPISIDYDVSKAGVNMLTKDFSLTLNSKVIAICPGWIKTDTISQMNPIFLKEDMEKHGQRNLIDPDKLVDHILDNIDNYETGEIVVIKEL